ncbi:hypothetical protein ACNFU2_17035 [Chryseobacterium sp. PTM-20240506]|uniref:hypothetical protein n=1 Tax=Chryseobacterium sp. PTM-20240506 TaxID=3400631 RepID=UPI0027A48A41|nr:hypothetical protein PFY10_16460 [Chryseobacterium daecheongense]
MKNIPLFSHQNPKSIQIESLISRPLSNGRLVLYSDYCPSEICRVIMSKRCLLMDGNY